MPQIDLRSRLERREDQPGLLLQDAIVRDVRQQGRLFRVWLGGNRCRLHDGLHANSCGITLCRHKSTLSTWTATLAETVSSTVLAPHVQDKQHDDGDDAPAIWEF